MEYLVMNNLDNFKINKIKLIWNYYWWLILYLNLSTTINEKRFKPWFLLLDNPLSMFFFVYVIFLSVIQ